MTTAEAKDRVISIASAEVGYPEVGDNWTKYADELDKIGITWGNKQNLPWCGEWVLWVFYRAFGRKLGLELLCSPDPSGVPLCSAGAQYFKDAGRWSKTPERGDVIFFYSGGNINHTGIVESVSGGVVHTIEGNSSDMVARRAYATGSTNIAGYGKPNWSLVSEVHEEDPVIAPTKPPQSVASTTDIPMLQKGDKSEVVKALKALLVLRGYKGKFSPSNNYFGSETRKAVLKFQADHGLEQDGIVGQYTWAALLGL